MKVCDALCEARGESGKSQEFMALELGVSRKTVQNWESGASEPSVTQAIEWFRILNISPLPYFLQIVHTDMQGINSKDDVGKLRAALLKLVGELPEDSLRQLLYLFYGTHGSSPRAILNMLTAHLQTPLEDRVTSSTLILKSYELAKKKGKTTEKDHVQPNLELLKKAIAMGEEAAVKNANAYVIKE